MKINEYIRVIGLLITSVSIYSCNNNSPKIEKPNTNIEGRWVYSNLEEKSYVEFWFYEDNLLFYNTSLNEIIRIKFHIIGNQINIYELDGVSESYYPGSGIIRWESKNSFTYILNPDSDPIYYLFEKLEGSVDSASFYSADPNTLLQKYFADIY